MKKIFGLSSIQKRRIEIFKFIVPFIVIALLGRLFTLQVINHKYYVKIAGSQHWSKDTIQAKRGEIYVEDGFSKSLYPLATNETRDMVYVVPEELENKDETIGRLSDILKIEKGKTLASLENSRLYVPLKKKLSDDEIRAITDLKFKGVYLSKEQYRYYPEGSLASQILGYVNNDGDGQYGLEEQYNDILKGVNGLYKAESDSQGRKIAFGKDVSKPAKDGDSIVLTINRDIQSEVEKTLQLYVKKFGAEGGSVIIMDPSTGEIIAMANVPTFNPNSYTEVTDFNVFKNKAVTDEYEPGSIFKAITMATGLNDGKVEPDSKYIDTGNVVLNGNKIMNSDKLAHGEQTMTNVLEKSLNTGVAYVLSLIGKDTFHDYINKFGFGQKTGIETGSEALGNVPPPSAQDLTYATMSFGQGISATPIQMVDSFGAIANGGKLMKPHLIKEIIKSDGSKEEIKPEEIRQVISGKSAASLTAMLVSVVEHGHGYQAKVRGYKVAGKTGTAQVPLKNGRGYDTSRNIGSFIGFAPALEPRFVVMAKIDAPKDVQWAESTAAPVVGELMDKLLKYYQVPPTEMNQLNAKS